MLMFIQLATYNNLTRVTGCIPKCKYTRDEYHEQAIEDVKWKTNWISSFYLMPKSSSFQNVVEVYKFGYSDLLADFGSYLGLFLGWSLLSIARDIPAWLIWWKNSFKKMFNRCKSAYREKQKVGTV